MLGYTESELHERTFLEITHERDRKANQELVRELVEGMRQSFQIEKRYCRKDGTLVWVRNNVVRVAGMDAEEPFWFGIVEDITQDELRSPNTPEMTWTAPPDGRFDFISELSQDISGISKEALNSTLDEWTKGNNSLPSLFAGLLPMSLRGSRGNVVRFVGSYAYIEPLKRAQQSLKESETRLQAFFENSPNLVFLKDRQGRYLHVNKEFKRALRITEEQIKGKRDDEIFSLEQAASFHSNDRQVLDAGVPMEFEEVSFQEDGPHTSIVHKFPLLNAAGEIYAIGGIATDITERKRAEKELLALRDELAAELTAMTRLHEFSTHLLTIDELQSLVEEVLDGAIALQNADFGNIQLYNHETQALEIVAQRGFQQDFLEHFRCMSDNGTACGRAMKLRERVIIEDVQTDSEFAPHRHIAESAGFRAVQSTPLLSRNCELLGMLSTHFRRPHRPSLRDLRFTDLYARHLEEVLERKQAQQVLQMTQVELARVSRLTTMGELAASIAHEVNQPLAAVTNNSSACLRLLASGNLKPEVLCRSLQEMVADGTRASAVIARIRAFIQKTPGERNLVDMNEIIQEVLDLTARELFENRVQIDRQLTEPIPRVSGDRVQLQQILLNLIMNSIEAMVAVTNRPRSLWVQSGLYESDNVLIAVRDSGTGIGSDADRVFTPFFTTKAHGMGMGLSISRSLIEAHGGRLWAEPNSPYGTVFYFTLPVGARTPS
jgi:PAS domain S-box-containing protein